MDIDLNSSKYAGLLWIGLKHADIHIFVKKEYWGFGWKCDWFDGPWGSFCFGPIIMLCFDIDATCAIMEKARSIGITLNSSIDDD